MSVGTFSRDDTQMMKGVAILFMLFLHLFNSLDRSHGVSPLLYIGEYPFVYLLTSATSPVGFFLFLSGYGLYISYSKGYKNNIKRIKWLYIHYWVTLIIFVSIGAMVKPNLYPGDFCKIFENITAWNTSYNTEIWFLFPYVLLALTSKWTLSLIDKLKPWLILITTYSLYIVAICLIHFYGSEYLFTHQLVYMPILYFDLLFAFCLGAMSAKYIDINRFRIKVEGGKKGLLMIIGLVLIMIMMRNYHSAVISPFYVAAFTLVFVTLPVPQLIRRFLVEMGNRSTSIWFVHTYFCYYLFRDFIYSFKYPILIFFVLLLVSYLTAVVVDYIVVKIKKMYNNWA